MNSPDQKALQASRRIHEASFPGIEGLAAVAAGAAVLARRRDGSEVAGRLGAFDGRDGRIEIERDGATERLAFDELQWLKLVEPTDPSRSADAFRGAGIPVESLPSVSPFGIAFTNGQVLGGELHGYGAALGGLGVYLAQEDGQATRLFIPAGAIESFTVGERLGKLLLERGQITADGLELALERQRALRKQTLGELLLHQRLISRGDLEKALAGQGAKPVQRLGEVLVEMGILDRTQLDTALGAQRANRRKPLGEILLELQMIDRETLESVLAQKLGIPFVDLRRFAFDTNWADLAPYPVCRDHAIVPLYRAAGTTVVALANPLDIENLNVVSFAIGTPVQPVLASSADIAWGIERHPERRLYETMEEAAAATPEAEDAETLASQLGREFGGAQAEQAVEQRVNPGDSTLVRLVNKIIADAYHQKASDIHFEPGNGHERLRVRFRRDGALFDYLTLSSRFRPAIISRLKIMASLDITDHRHAQDGKIDCRRFGGLPLELRMAVIPTVGGFESVVLRLLAAATALPFEKIGLAEEDLARLKALAEKPYGLILVCGPTGSGKTTTLHSVLRHVNKPDTKIWTAEDPVEITQAGLNRCRCTRPSAGPSPRRCARSCAPIPTSS
jgi:hypothetical protein